MHKLRYADTPAAKGEARLVRLFRTLILVGVWVLVALAGFAAWVKLTA